MKTLAQIYRERRIRLGLTQEQAAGAAGVSRRTLVDFETGGQRITVANLLRLLNAIGLELATRERSARPTLDELSGKYGGDDTQKIRQRSRPKKTI